MERFQLNATDTIRRVTGEIENIEDEPLSHHIDITLIGAESQIDAIVDLINENPDAWADARRVAHPTEVKPAPPVIGEYIEYRKNGKRFGGRYRGTLDDKTTIVITRHDDRVIFVPESDIVKRPWA